MFESFLPRDTWCVDWNCGSMASEKLLGIEIALLRHYRRREFAEVTNSLCVVDTLTVPASLAEPPTSAHARGSGCKPMIGFVPLQEFLQLQSDCRTRNYRIPYVTSCSGYAPPTDMAGRKQSAGEHVASSTRKYEEQPRV